MAHRDFYPTRAQIKKGLQPSSEFHDVLLIPPRRRDGERTVAEEEFVRFPVVKVGKKPGSHVDPPEVWDRKDTGQRKVLNVARPEQVEVGDLEREPRGPVFAAFPVRPEPGASSCAMCYLVDAENLVSPNAWTAEEWDATSQPDLPAAPGADATEAEVLLGLSRGIVLRLKVTGLDKLDDPANQKRVTTTENGVTYELEPVRLKREPEIWNQLRNGTVAGRALYRALQSAREAPRVLPLVNVTSLKGPNP